MLGNYKITFSLFFYLHTFKGRAGDKCQGWDNLGNYLDVWLKHFFFLSQYFFYLFAFNFCLTISKLETLHFMSSTQIKLFCKGIVESLSHAGPSFWNDLSPLFAYLGPAHPQVLAPTPWAQNGLIL